MAAGPNGMEALVRFAYHMNHPLPTSSSSTLPVHLCMPFQNQSADYMLPTESTYVLVHPYAAVVFMVFLLYVHASTSSATPISLRH
jgi:hypothetical protein